MEQKEGEKRTLCWKAEGSWLPIQDLNPDKLSQSQVCYRYTNRQCRLRDKRNHTSPGGLLSNGKRQYPAPHMLIWERDFGISLLGARHMPSTVFSQIGEFFKELRYSLTDGLLFLGGPLDIIVALFDIAITAMVLYVILLLLRDSRA